MVERRIELVRRTRAERKMKKLKAKLESATGRSATRCSTRSMLEPVWTEPAATEKHRRKRRRSREEEVRSYQ